MDLNSKKVKGLGLCSGGLDSILSAYVLREQSITVEWITFETPFFSAAKAKKAAANADIPLTVKNITVPYITMLKNPPNGYGQNMNPCMDCHALMFNLAGAVMKEKGFDFLFSGEVMGQRPMSQTKQSLRYVEKHSGYDGYILRPLSARLLPETIPEKNGLVDKEKLLDISGRSRKPQIKLAKKFNIINYPAPAGGCRLTDKHFSARLRDLFAHQDEYTENEFHLLKYGRHLRLLNKAKLIVGREEEDNEQILKYYNSQKDTLLIMDKVPGPIALIPNSGGDDSIMLAASLCVGYSKADNTTPTGVKVTGPKSQKTIRVLGIPPQSVKKLIL